MIEDDRPEPDTLADVARDYGVPEWALRAALRRCHPDASPLEVSWQAGLIATPHPVRPTDDRLTCRDCDRPIRKGPRRPSGLYWRHVRTTSRST